MYRRTGRGRLVLVVFLAFSIILITLDFRQDSGVLERTKDIAANVVAPIQRGVTTVLRLSTKASRSAAAQRSTEPACCLRRRTCGRT